MERKKNETGLRLVMPTFDISLIDQLIKALSFEITPSFDEPYNFLTFFSMRVTPTEAKVILRAMGKKNKLTKELFWNALPARLGTLDPKPYGVDSWETVITYIKSRTLNTAAKGQHVGVTFWFS